MSQQTLPCTPPPKTIKGGLIFFVYAPSVPKKMSSKESLYFSRVIQAERPKNVVFEHIHSNQILINLTLFYNKE